MKIKSHILIPSIYLGLLMLAGSAWSADPAPAAKDQAQLQGEWDMVSVQRDGEELPATPGSKRICKDDETTVIIGGQTMLKAKFTLNPGAKPKAIDYSVSEGPMAGQKMLGIYEVDGDSIKFCFAMPGKDRPDAFESKSGDGRTFSVWKRAKKTDAKADPKPTPPKPESK